MSCFEKEAELIGYRGIYCRLCDYFTGEIRNVARRALEMVEKHGELKIFAEKTGAFNYEELVRGLKWMATTLTPCIGGCRGSGAGKLAQFVSAVLVGRLTSALNAANFHAKYWRNPLPEPWIG